MRSAPSNLTPRSGGQPLLLALASLLALGLAVAGCDQKPSPEPPRAKPEATADRAGKPHPPAPAPVEKASEQIKDTYQWYCAQCHGIHGKGDGINARLLTVLPRDHTKADYLETRTDEQLFQAIKSGGLAAGRAPCMPGWGHTLDDGAIHGLVRYIRELCNCEAS